MPPWTQPKRYSKGCFMKLKSIELLRAFVVTKEDLEAFRDGKPVQPKITQRNLARKSSVHPSFINHLTAGRKTTCDPATAERIAEALGVPLEVLFMPNEPTAKRCRVNQKLAKVA